MNNFRFENTTKILFGKGTQNKIGEYVVSYSKNILLVYGRGSAKKNGSYDSVVASLTEHNIQYTELSGVSANPNLSLINKGIEICRNKGIEFIVALGGGSVIDTAKAIAAGIVYHGDLWDAFVGKSTIKSVGARVGVVLTIPASGSETSNACVVTNDCIPGAYKKSIASNDIRPVFAILNPELAQSLSSRQVACGGIDIFSHVLERYFTNVKNVELSDRLCEATLKTLLNNLPKAVLNPSDYNAMAEVMWSGTVAHNNLLSAGRRSDWGSHQIGHELTSLYGISHGTSLAIVFPAWMKYVYKHDVNRFVQYANRVFDIDVDFYDLEYVAQEGIRRTETFFRELGQPTSLQEVNLLNADINLIARRATMLGNFGDFMKLGEKEVVDILKLARG